MAPCPHGISEIYLNAEAGTLSLEPLAKELFIRLKANDNNGQTVFTIPFDKDTELPAT